MDAVDKINSYNALVSANHTESFIAPEKPKTVSNTMEEQLKKNNASKEAERVTNTGYSSSPAINSKLNSSTQKNNTASSGYSGNYYSNSGYSSNGYSSGYNNGYNQNSQYKGNNLDYNSRLAKIRQMAKDTAASQKKYEQSRGAGLVDFDGKYSFSIENGKVKHHTNKRRKIINKNTAKQIAVAAGVIVLEAALGVAMAEAKNGIANISNEIKKSLNSKSK